MNQIQNNQAPAAAGVQSAEEALLTLMRERTLIIDTALAEFCRDVFDEGDKGFDGEENPVVAHGDPMALSDEDFIRYADQKFVEWEELDSWAENEDRGREIIRAVCAVGLPAVVEARLGLEAKLEKLGALRRRIMNLDCMQHA